MRYLIFILLFTSPLPATASQACFDVSELRIERPIKTFRRIKKEIRRERQTWFVVVGLSVWAALFAWFAATLGLGFVLLFGGGCLALVLFGLFI